MAFCFHSLPLTGLTDALSRLPSRRTVTSTLKWSLTSSETNFVQERMHNMTAKAITHMQYKSVSLHVWWRPAPASSSSALSHRPAIGFQWELNKAYLILNSDTANGVKCKYWKICFHSWMSALVYWLVSVNPQCHYWWIIHSSYVMTAKSIFRILWNEDPAVQRTRIKNCKDPRLKNWIWIGIKLSIQN